VTCIEMPGSDQEHRAPGGDLFAESLHGIVPEA
jgi:hypothetical protein